MNMPESKTGNLTCESCGKEFFCGANIGKCWCFEVDLEKEALAKLRERFNNCLCEDCLKNMAETRLSRSL